MRGLTIRGSAQHSDASTVLPKRPGYGTAGRSIKVLANYFKIQPTANLAQTAIHYDVDIRPTEDVDKPRGPADRPLPPKLCRRVIMEAGKTWPLGWGFDGRKNLYAPQRILPQAPTSFVVLLPRDQDIEGVKSPPRSRGAGPPSGPGSNMKSFTVTTKEVAMVDMQYVFNYLSDAQRSGATAAFQDPTPLAVLDTLMRWMAACDPNNTIVGRSVYYFDERLHANLGGGVETMPGYVQHHKPSQAGLLLNLDLVMSAMWKTQELVRTMADMLGFRDPRDMVQRLRMPDMARRWKRELSGVRVSIGDEGGTRRKTIRGVSEVGAAQLMFYNEKEGRDMSVAEYFDKIKKRRLTYPQLPCINVSTQPDKKTWIPVELCTVQPGQRRTKLDGPQTAAIIKKAAQRPGEKMEYLNGIASWVQENSKALLSKWGLQMSDKMAEVDARILPPPYIMYGNPTCMNVGENGSWNLRDVKFLQGRPLKSWGVVSLVRREDFDLARFLEELYRMLVTCGVQVGNTRPQVVWGNMGNIAPSLHQARDLAERQFNMIPQLILVALPAKEVQPYKEVKRVSDTELGIPSQCFVVTKAGGPQYCANVALKINAKLDGINGALLADQTNPARFMLRLGEYPHFVVMGADVTHPTAAARRDPGERSIAAVVCSRDRTLCRFASRMLLQAAGAEVIVDLKGAARELLLTYYRENGQNKPQAILFYRDGVAEGQFSQVLEEEYKALREACSSLEQSYAPAITFVVVQKRHNTRLLPAPGSPTDRSGNIMPGTVVDRTICSPYEYDFFLNSHAGLQGTNKPAHYHVLRDEMGFGADALQLLTYWLCFLYARCTKSVSYCPPAYYAHLVAFRARSLFTSTSDSSSEVSGVEAGPSFRTVHANIQDRMYYM